MAAQRASIPALKALRGRGKTGIETRDRITSGVSRDLLERVDDIVNRLSNCVEKRELPVDLLSDVTKLLDEFWRCVRISATLLV